MDLRMLLNESRPRVYLLWAVLTGAGYTVTHFYQNPNINFIWFVLAAIGFGYMYKVMPLKVKQMRQIYAAWLIPVSLGFVFSVVAARTDLLPELIGYLGAFWLFISALGFFWNGLADPPARWYFIASCANFVAAIACYLILDFTVYQYLIAAIVSVWSMLCLWLFRSDV